MRLSKAPSTRYCSSKAAAITTLTGLQEKLEWKVKDADIYVGIASMPLSDTMHCSQSTGPRLGEIVMDHRLASSLEHLQLQNTKCTCLIKNVISPYLKEDFDG